MSPERRRRRMLLYTARLLKAAFKRGHARARRRLRLAAERRQRALNAARRR
jgi:hypothetical protein